MPLIWVRFSANEASERPNIVLFRNRPLSLPRDLLTGRSTPKNSLAIRNGQQYENCSCFSYASSDAGRNEKYDRMERKNEKK